MKTETQIAEENIKNLESAKETVSSELVTKSKVFCISHKATCQRFLEFFKECIGLLPEKRFILNKLIQGKIKDLKQTIKLYNEAGIQ